MTASIRPAHRRAISGQRGSSIIPDAPPRPSRTQSAPPSTAVHPFETSLASASTSEVRAGTPADGLRRVVTLEEANRLFQAIASNPDIPHHFLDEGCLLRAHVAAKWLEESGVYSEKLAVKPVQGDLLIETDRHPLGFSIQMLHIAPVIYVELPGGNVERRVLDPAFFSGPIPEEHWLRPMRGLNGSVCERYLLSRFTLNLWQRDEKATAWKPEELALARAWKDDYKRVEKMLGEMGYYEHLRQLKAAAEPSSSEDFVGP